MDEKRKIIRKYTWILLIIFILEVILTLNGGSYNLAIVLIAMALSLTGLFINKKWGFYIFTIYLVYLLIFFIISFDLLTILIFLVIYVYLIWYNGFYRNLKEFD